MPIPGHELLVVRKSPVRGHADFLLMRGDCSCGRRGCVYYRTTEEVEKSFSHHVAHVAAEAVSLVNRIEAEALATTDTWVAPRFVEWVKTTVAATRREGGW